MKKYAYAVLMITIFVMGLGIWTWLMEFGGWEAIFKYSRYHQLSRLKSFFDHPNIYSKWQSSMKIFDPLYLEYWYMPRKLKTFDLSISNADLHELNINLPEPYSSKNLAKKNKIKVKGELIAGGVNKTVEISYRGNSFDHWSDIKKSWKLKFDSGEELNLILPSDRGYFSESLSNYRARKLGLLSQNDDWAWLRVNGEDMGVYYVMGGWNEFWMERNGIKISQLVGELDYQIGNVIFPYVWDGIWNWKYYTHRINERFPNSFYLQKFLDTINNFNGEQFDQAISQIVDIESLVRWKALSILNNSFHTDDFHNWRMYLNPESLKFQIIPLDMYVVVDDWYLPDRSLTVDHSIDKLSSKIDTSAELTLLINKVLWDYIRDNKQLDDDLKYWDILAEKLMPEMYADNKKHLGNISLRKVYLMRQKIKSHYENIKNYLTKEDLRLKIEKTDAAINLVISSFQPTQVIIESVIINGQKLVFPETLLFSRRIVSIKEGDYLFDREQGELKIPISCLKDCRIKVIGKNLVTGIYQEASQ